MIDSNPSDRFLVLRRDYYCTPLFDAAPEEEDDDTLLLRMGSMVRDVRRHSSDTWTFLASDNCGQSWRPFLVEMEEGKTPPIAEVHAGRDDLE
jgi:hypothetical protein